MLYASSLDVDGLRPVALFFPDKSARWVADACRTGRIPGAVRVGRQWLIRPSDFDAFVSGNAIRCVPTVEQAAADLRSRGVL